MNPNMLWQRTLLRGVTLLAVLIPWLGGCGSEQREASEPADRPTAAEPSRQAESEWRLLNEQRQKEEQDRLRLEKFERPRQLQEQQEAHKSTKAARAPAAARDAPAKAAGPAAPAAATPSESRLTPIAAVDRILDSLARANIAFNAPETINLAASAQIQLLLSLEQSIDDLRNALTQPGEKEGAQIRVSDRMEAHLTGQNFQITAITPGEQAITSIGTTEWKWEVKPVTPGRHGLHLTLTALFEVDGKSTRRAIRTFDKTIAVDVTLSQQFSGFVARNWQWLWTALLVPLVVWLVKKRKSRGARPIDTDT